LKNLGSDGKSIHSYREIKNIHFKHDADDEARYTTVEAGETRTKNIVEVSQKYNPLTPNKVVTK
jgi:hypothetical protein